MLVAIHLPDGTVYTAADWELLEERAIQVERDLSGKRGLTKRDFREGMAKTAIALSGTEIMTNGSSDDFFWELERAGILRTIAYATTEDQISHEPYEVDLSVYRSDGDLIRQLDEMLSEGNENDAEHSTNRKGRKAAAEPAALRNGWRRKNDAGRASAKSPGTRARTRS